MNEEQFYILSANLLFLSSEGNEYKRSSPWKVFYKVSTGRLMRIIKALIEGNS